MHLYGSLPVHQMDAAWTISTKSYNRRLKFQQDRGHPIPFHWDLGTWDRCGILKPTSDLCLNYPTIILAGSSANMAIQVGRYPKFCYSFWIMPWWLTHRQKEVLTYFFSRWCIDIIVEGGGMAFCSFQFSTRACQEGGPLGREEGVWIF